MKKSQSINYPLKLENDFHQQMKISQQKITNEQIHKNVSNFNLSKQQYNIPCQFIHDYKDNKAILYENRPLSRQLFQNGSTVKKQKQIYNSRTLNNPIILFHNESVSKFHDNGSNKTKQNKKISLKKNSKEIRKTIMNDNKHSKYVNYSDFKPKTKYQLILQEFYGKKISVYDQNKNKKANIKYQAKSQQKITNQKMKNKNLRSELKNKNQLKIIRKSQSEKKYIYQNNTPLAPITQSLQQNSLHQRNKSNQSESYLQIYKRKLRKQF